MGRGLGVRRRRAGRDRVRMVVGLHRVAEARDRGGRDRRPPASGLGPSSDRRASAVAAAIGASRLAAGAVERVERLVTRGRAAAARRRRPARAAGSRRPVAERVEDALREPGLEADRHARGGARRSATSPAASAPRPPANASAAAADAGDRSSCSRARTAADARDRVRLGSPGQIGAPRHAREQRVQRPVHAARARGPRAAAPPPAGRSRRSTPRRSRTRGASSTPRPSAACAASPAPARSPVRQRDLREVHAAPPRRGVPAPANDSSSARASGERAHPQVEAREAEGERRCPGGTGPGRPRPSRTSRAWRPPVAGRSVTGPAAGGAPGRAGTAPGATTAMRSASSRTRSCGQRMDVVRRHGLDRRERLVQRVDAVVERLLAADPRREVARVVHPQLQPAGEVRLGLRQLLGRDRLVDQPGELREDRLDRRRRAGPGRRPPRSRARPRRRTRRRPELTS